MGRYWPIQRISVFFFHILSSEAPSMRNFIVPSCRWVWAVRGVYRAPMSQNLSKVHKFFTSLKVHNFVLKFQDLRENIILRKMCFLSLFKILQFILNSKSSHQYEAAHEAKFFCQKHLFDERMVLKKMPYLMRCLK